MQLDALDHILQLQSHAGDRDKLDRDLYVDVRSYLCDNCLVKVDRMSMACSLETRVPFLDPAVLELSARLPVQMKIRGGVGKWALRQVLFRHVPRRMIERPKAGFGSPIAEWLRGPLKPWAEDLLARDRLERDGLFDPDPIQRAWSEHQSGYRDRAQRLWVILMFQAWKWRTYDL